MAEKITVALAGNPNSGKTTVFNNLTGARQHVGNYPGVTVETKEGTCRHDGVEMSVVDLPGTYSLTAYSVEEMVARNLIIDGKPDVVVDVIDASNLERNLYLAVQFIELGVPLVLAFNMSDVAQARGYEFDLEQLSKLLGAPIVLTVGHKRRGMTELLETAIAVARGTARYEPVPVHYGREIEEEIAKIETLLAKDPALAEKYDPRWVAVKLLEEDADVRKKVSVDEILAQVEKSTQHLEQIFGDTAEIVIADRRYGFISGACTEAVRSTVESRHTMSDRIDAVLTNRILGLPIFLVLMWLVFKLTFTAGGPPMEWIDDGFSWLGGMAGRVLGEGYLGSLVVDGVIAGVGGVLVFLPNILFLFLAIAVLEDSGYMARAAFITDRLMHRIGLHGKSFIPMLIGFGCTVPAVMATRTLESRRDRFITILIAPLMSCGARFPVYVLLTGAFFPRNAVWVIFSIYLLGILLAIVMAKVFGKWVLPGESEPFVIELPPYRVPTARGVLIHMWQRGWMYLRKAGTIILVFAIVIWALSSFPSQPALEASYQEKIESAGGDEELVRRLENELSEQKLERSFAGRIGHAIAPVLKPVGLGDWKIGTALFAGFGAKEIVVSTMGTLYSLGETDADEAKILQRTLRKDQFFSPLVAYTLMVFVLVYVPCIAVVAVVKAETRSWRWPLFMIGYTTALAWVASLVVYWGGRLLGLGGA